MQKWIESFLASLLIVFAPIKAAIVVTALLVIVDLVTGVMASKKQGKPITSGGLKRTVGKIFLYEVTIIISFLVQKYLTGDDFMALKVVSALIGMTELKSIIENLDTINGSNVLKSLLDMVVKSKEDLEPKKEKHHHDKKDS